MSTFPQETRDLMKASGGGGTRNFLPKIFNEATELTKGFVKSKPEYNALQLGAQV